MAVESEIMLQGHRNIYNDGKERQLKAYYSLPDQGVNAETGILLLIPGFGANSDSKIFKKMRRLFADQYNLVVIQCDYFGSEFVGDRDGINLNVDMMKAYAAVFSEEERERVFAGETIDLDYYIETIRKYTDEIVLYNSPPETQDNFNDMGLLQTLDNIYAVLQVMSILYDQDMIFNAGKVIAFGDSHGAYLAHMCNIMSGTLFTHIIDNSAWIQPLYLDRPRCRVLYNANSINYTVLDEYVAGKALKDRQILNLGYLYSQVENHAQVICYQGSTDDMVDSKDKAKLADRIKATFVLVDPSMVDGKLFKTTDHSLGADYLLLFDDAYSHLTFEQADMLDLVDRIEIRTDMRKYIFDYSNILPELHWA